MSAINNIKSAITSLPETFKSGFNKVKKFLGMEPRELKGQRMPKGSKKASDPTPGRSIQTRDAMQITKEQIAAKRPASEPPGKKLKNRSSIEQSKKPLPSLPTRKEPEGPKTKLSKRNAIIGDHRLQHQEEINLQQKVAQKKAAKNQAANK